MVETELRHVRKPTVSGMWEGAASPVARAILVIGIVIILLVFFAVRMVPEHVVQAQGTTVFLEYPNLGNLSVRETAELFDTAPLILPTKWNYASDLSGMRLREEDSAVLFAPFPPELALRDPGAFKSLGVVRSKIIRPEDLLSRGKMQFFKNFGALVDAGVPVPMRSGFIEISSLLDGGVVRSMRIAGELAGLGEDLSMWVFHVVIDPIGAVGEALMVRGSGSEEADREVRDYLNSLQALAGIRPGYYRVTIGP
jgi:hypothetical protein